MAVQGDLSAVSIHSPRRSEGRPDGRLHSHRPLSMFQSTPPAEARGDMFVASNGAPPLCFNPLPPPKRGETRALVWRFTSSGVSIHSPRRSEGRRIGGAVLTTSYCFNPLPPPKRGETVPVRPPQHDPRVSIHSPRRSEGRHQQASLTRNGQGVSIHSPRRSEGRLPRRKCCTTSRVGFNPLPPPKRGETHGLMGFEPVSKVSIHSPRRSEGRLQRQLGGDVPTPRFQSTPPAEARGDSSAS